MTTKNGTLKINWDKAEPHKRGTVQKPLQSHWFYDNPLTENEDIEDRDPKDQNSGDR